MSLSVIEKVNFMIFLVKMASQVSQGLGLTPFLDEKEF